VSSSLLPLSRLMSCNLSVAGGGHTQPAAIPGCKSSRATTLVPGRPLPTIGKQLANLHYLRTCHECNHLPFCHDGHLSNLSCSKLGPPRSMLKGLDGLVETKVLFSPSVHLSPAIRRIIRCGICLRQTITKNFPSLRAPT